LKKNQKNKTSNLIDKTNPLITHLAIENPSELTNANNKTQPALNKYFCTKSVQNADFSTAFSLPPCRRRWLWLSEHGFLNDCGFLHSYMLQCICNPSSNTADDAQVTGIPLNNPAHRINRNDHAQSRQITDHTAGICRRH
jgi:hypothetical protein